MMEKKADTDTPLYTKLMAGIEARQKLRGFNVPEDLSEALDLLLQLERKLAAYEAAENGLPEEPIYELFMCDRGEGDHEEIFVREVDYKKLRAQYAALKVRLDEEKKLSEAISRDCNTTALERNKLRGELAQAESRVAKLEAKWKWIFEQKDGTKLSVDELCSMKEAKEQAEALSKSKQSKIDALMFEYCPNEMTPEQIAEFERSQRVATLEEKSAIDAARREKP